MPLEGPGEGDRPADEAGKLLTGDGRALSTRGKLPAVDCRLLPFLVGDGRTLPGDLTATGEGAPPEGKFLTGEDATLPRKLLTGEAGAVGEEDAKRDLRGGATSSPRKGVTDRALDGLRVGGTTETSELLLLTRGLPGILTASPSSLELPINGEETVLNDMLL